ncbi:hypothetical protein P4645_15290 [Lysinibacillus fusiformis]|uniref:hypothetical protein n=1 Tax=Lysinibacillus fusiformis TaxID=28031 RepID=UPI002E1BDE43|nr:hypothetical protein [Lysinibacillus fusiformis]
MKLISNNVINFMEERKKRMFEMVLREPLQRGLNIIKITAKDNSFATTAIVEVEKVNVDEIYCKKIRFVSTLGIINVDMLNKAVLNYINKQKLPSLVV